MNISSPIHTVVNTGTSGHRLNDLYITTITQFLLHCLLAIYCSSLFFSLWVCVCVCVCAYRQMCRYVKHFSVHNSYDQGVPVLKIPHHSPLFIWIYRLRFDGILDVCLKEFNGLRFFFFHYFITQKFKSITSAISHLNEPFEVTRSIIRFRIWTLQTLWEMWDKYSHLANCISWSLEL